MSAVSQKIPNLFGGISQQPDSKKVPGQVRNLVNGYPEFSLGLIKRPGCEFKHDLISPNIADSKVGGKWFNIPGSSNEKYVAQFSSSISDTGSNRYVPKLKIWDTIDGLQYFVDYTACIPALGDADYDAHSTAAIGHKNDIVGDAENPGLFQKYGEAAIKNSDSIANNRANFLSEVQQHQQQLNGMQDEIHAYFKLKSTYNPSDINDILVDGVLLQGTTYSYNRSGVSYTVDNIPDELSISTNERTDDLPQLARLGYRVFDILETTTGVETYQQPEHGDDFLDPEPENPSDNQTHGNYMWSGVGWVRNVQDSDKSLRYQESVDGDIKNYIDEVGDYETDVDAAFATRPVESYLAVKDPQNLEFLTDNQITYILNKEVIVGYTDNDSPAGLEDTWMVTLNIFEPSKEYTLKVYYDNHDPEGTASETGSTAFTGGTLDAFYTAIKNHGWATGDKELTIERSENTFAIKMKESSSPRSIKNIEVLGPGVDFIQAIKREVSDISRLPNHALHGKKVKIVNTADSSLDDMWVRYQLSSWDPNSTDPEPDEGTFGEGSWVETVAPGIKYELDPNTLPHKLTRIADGHFELSPITWENRRVGDLETNPGPSFVGSNINGMFFYRNRFGLLSGANINMSRADRFFDFFGKSAVAVGDDDPIDVTAVSSQPVDLSYVTQTSVGLLIFGTTEQFLLTVGNDILAPDTANINSIGRYAITPKLEAQALGTSTVFFSKTKNFLASHEFVNISSTQPPTAFDHTTVVPELLPSSIDQIATSPAKSIISYGASQSNTIYQYRFLRIGEEELATAWYKWTLPGKLIYQYFDDTVLNCVIQDTDPTEPRAYLVSFDLNQANTNGYLKASEDFKFDPCLDLWNVNPICTYDAATDVTQYTLPYRNSFAGSEPVAIVLDTSGDQQLHSLSPEIIYTGGGNDSEDDSDNMQWDIPGDQRGKDIIFGWKYTMEVELPTIYLQGGGETMSTDTDSNLIIKKLNVLTGPSGPLSFKVEYKGIDAQVSTQDVALSYEAEAESTYTLVNTEANVYKLNTLNVSLSDSRSVPVYQRNTNVTIKAIGDTPLPVNILSIAWEGRATSKFYRRG